MKQTSKNIQRVYLSLTTMSTLAFSLIWGINTIFLLDAGLSISQAFAVNAFFTFGQVIFEIPTGVVADLKGRGVSYLFGVVTLLFATLLYLAMWYFRLPFWAWAVSSLFIGLGFTFFSGATEAWLVDALNFCKFQGDMEEVFAKGQIASGAAMLVGSIAGGFIAQITNLGVPYILRCLILFITFFVALGFMKDVGFKPKADVSVKKQMGSILRNSIEIGFKKPPLRFMIISAPFLAGAGFYAFYAMQPYLLGLYGRSNSYGIVGIAAASIAASQILAGMVSKKFRGLFSKRTNAIILGITVSSISLLLVGVLHNFYSVFVFLILWSLSFTIVSPIRQAYINNLIPSQQRATILSFDSLFASSGAVVSQPALGFVADVWSYSVSYTIAAVVQITSLPFVFLAKTKSSKVTLAPKA